MRIPKLFATVLIVALMSSILPAQYAGAQATDLLFSEYIEGSSFNKAVEIYNGTGAAVDLSTYTVQMYFNGSASPSQSLTLIGTLADGDVFVLAHPSADAAILAQADVTDVGISFNGDDVVILRNNGAVVDAFGQIGFDPGSEWPGGGQDDTLRRAESVCAGDTNPDDAFDASVEWVPFAQNTFDGLGAHTVNCGGPADLVINEIMQNPAAVPDSSGEWFELYNPGNSDVDVNGWTIADNDVDSHLINNGGPLLIPAGGYLVLGNNSDTSTNGGVNVGYSYGGSWFLSNAADEVILLDAALTEIDRVEYDGGISFPDPTGASMALSDSALDNNDGTNWCTSPTPFGAGDLGTPGIANDCMPPVPVQSVMIHDVQGNGSASPLVGTAVLIEGIVVGDFQDVSGSNGDLNGFFVQEEDADADGDPMTSEGIFVYDGNSPAIDVANGDLVSVTGQVSEFNDLTEITSTSGVTVLSSGNALPTAATLSLPVTSVDDFEAYEGMLVTFPQALVISEYFNFDRFGEIVLTSQRHLTPTAEFEPGPDSIAAASAFLLDKITLDDGLSIQNPDPAIHPDGRVFDLTNLLRGGDRVANVTGVMDYAFGLYRIQPTQGADYTSANPRTAAPDPVGGNLKVASFNVLNYFTTLDDGVNFICGPAGDQNCRGADDATEFTRQRDKIIGALTAIDADMVGLIEIENHVNDEALQDLVNGLNAVPNAGPYNFVSTGTIGTDAIKVAMIYKPASVSLVGGHAILDSSVDAGFIDTKNRPTLAQTFMDNSTGSVFTVAVNHLKSKGSPCDDVSDPDTGNGSGNCNLTRKAAAEALVAWLATDPTGSGDEDFLIIGDLNAYDKEDPIDAVVAGGYTDLIHHFLGEGAYSFVFDGQLGYLDHALANAGLMDEITGVTIWHINADEPDLIDYDTSFKQDAQDAIYAPDAFRSSDHDPVIIGLRGTLPDTNNPPSMPNLVSPANGQQNLPTTVTFQWTPVTDPDNDPVSYDLTYCTDSNLVSNCNVQVASLQKGTGISYAGLGYGSGIMIFGVVLAGGIAGRKKIALLLLMLFTTGALMVSCGSSTGVFYKSLTVSGLNSGTTYYWAVTAKDSNGAKTQSNVWRFTTK